MREGPLVDAEVPPLAVSVDKAAVAAGLGRSTLYEAIRAGDLRSAKIGARRVILLDDLRLWLFALRDGTR
jgi:excisionase family DNA binding protein